MGDKGGKTLTEEGFTTIRLKESTRDRINNLRRGNETQDEFVKRLIDEAYPEG